MLSSEESLIGKKWSKLKFWVCRFHPSVGWQLRSLYLSNLRMITVKRKLRARQSLKLVSYRVPPSWLDSRRKYINCRDDWKRRTQQLASKRVQFCKTKQEFKLPSISILLWAGKNKTKHTNKQTTKNSNGEQKSTILQKTTN